MRLQKNSFYILIPVVLFCAYSVAYLIRSVLVAFLNPAQKMTVQMTRSVGMQTQSEISKAVNIYEDMVEGNLIRGRKVVDLPTDPNAAAGAAPVLSEEVPGGDETILTGALSGHPSFARATFKEKDKEEADEFKLGEKIVGYKLKSIADHYAVIAKNGLNLKVEIGQSIKEAKAVYDEMMKANSSGAIAEKDLVAAEKKMLPISRTDFEKYMKNPADLYKDARFGPNLVNGKIDGYKVYQVATSHIFYQLGARNGDIVKRVNGMPLNDTEKMLEIWAAIKNSPKVTVDLERKEKIITYEFLIRN